MKGTTKGYQKKASINRKLSEETYFNLGKEGGLTLLLCVTS